MNGNHIRPIIDAAPVLLWVADADQRCVFFNNRWLAFVGRTLEEQLAHDWTENVHAEDRARCASIYLSAFERREEFQFECRLRRNDGECHRAIANGAPRLTPGGDFAGFVGAFTVHRTDLSAYQGGSGTRRLSSIGTLAAGIAHDFNNLLANILANADLALAEVGPESRAALGLERIRTVAVRGAEIVRELMVYSGQERSHAERIDLSKLVEEMLEMLRISVTKHASITTDLAPNLPHVIAEPAEISELVMNLILNASDSLGEKDGEIRISTSRVRRGVGGTGAGSVGSNGCLRLVVADTGSGIARSIRQRLFDPFVSTKRPGRGMGLATVHMIVQKYGGNIRVTSSPGRGTQFIVYLPCGPAAVQADARKHTPAHAAGDRRTVLVVEDEEGLRLAIARLLRLEGFRVFEAPDGSSAMALLRGRSNSIDAILLDLTIPGLTSKAVIGEAARLRPDVRIVLTSAYSRESAASELKAAHVKGFVRKPYHVREVIQLLTNEVGTSPSVAPSVLTSTGQSWR